MTKLHELTTQYRELSDMEDLDPEALADTLESLTGDIEAKANGIAMVRNIMLGDVTVIDAEIARLSARKKIIENRETSLREYLRVNMVAMGIKKISCPLFTVTLAKGRDIVVIDDADALPDECTKVTTSIQPDKKTIMELLKSGTEVAGARLGKSQDAVRIK